MRETRQEMKDHLAPLEATPEGIPLGPYANVLGRIVSIAELMNPVGNTPMWRLGLDVSGFRIDVLVRKDRCDGHPETGHYFSGSCWLVGSLEAAARADASYIR
jgi:hypothetical protein